MIDILISTYNGEKFLKQQLNSISQQTYKNWRAFIRDDGSTDNTLKIISQHIAIDDRFFLVQDKQQRLGPGKSFLSLLKFSTADYIVFSDQDDIWLENKLEKLFSFAEENFSPQQPSLVFSDAYYYADNKIQSTRVSMKASGNLSSFIFNNGGYQGCALLFNRALLEGISKKISLLSDIYMHDHIISLYAHTFGKVYYIDDKLFLYRQHINNVTGRSNKNFFKKITSYYSHEKSLINPKHYLEKKSFFNVYKSEMEHKDLITFDQYFNFPRKGKILQIVFAIKNQPQINGSKLKFFVKLLTSETLKTTNKNHKIT